MLRLVKLRSSNDWLVTTVFNIKRRHNIRKRCNEFPRRRKFGVRVPALGSQTVSAFLYLFFTKILSKVSSKTQYIFGRPQFASLHIGTLLANPESSNEWEAQVEQGLIDGEEKLEPTTLVENPEDLHRVRDVLRQEQQG